MKIISKVAATALAASLIIPAAFAQAPKPAPAAPKAPVTAGKKVAGKKAAPKKVVGKKTGAKKTAGKTGAKAAAGKKKA